ncbi:MAG: DNA primase [Patescibacteria group bacterium]|jgi:DNA primase
MATDTQAIKDRLDIVQIIGEYITLKKAGANWKANCPFHNEKSPSFMVHQEKQIWHCFGCGKGGDVFTFVQEMEGLDFVECLKLLAKRAGVEVNLDRNEENASLRNRLLEINNSAAIFYHRFLTELPAAEPARKYLENRGLKNQTITDWQIGYIPDQWELLTQYLLKKGFALTDLVLAGLTIRREGADEKTGQGFYDRFRGRIMFPIYDTHANVIGFTGRVLVETEKSGGKYVNTPETALYDKSRVLYGIHRAKTEIKAKDQAVVVEGQMDVIACHQAGMANVVAASGTALTMEQVKLLKRYSNNIIMAFDADAAGQKAGQRGIDVALENGMSIKVIQIPPGAGKDADECLKKNPTVWFDSVKNAKGVMDWYFGIHLSGLNKKDFGSKQKVAQALLLEISKIPNGVERDEWLKKLADDLSIEPSVLREEIKKIKSKVVSPVKVELSKVEIVVKSPQDNMEEEFWSLLLKHPENYNSLRDKIPTGQFFSSGFAGLYEAAERIYNKRNKITADDIRSEIANTGLSSSVELLLLRASKDFDNITPETSGKELEQLLYRIKGMWKVQRGKEIQSELADAEKLKDNLRISNLIDELQKIQAI